MVKAIISVIVIVAVLGIGGYFLFMESNKASVSQSLNDQADSAVENKDGAMDNPKDGAMKKDDSMMEGGAMMAKTHEVVYSSTGYAPGELKIKAGDTVVFKNESSSGMWTGSAMHPTHMVYGGTSLQEHCPDADSNDFDQCVSSDPGTTWSFTFTKTGTWAYHNHMKAAHFGKIIVE